MIPRLSLCFSGEATETDKDSDIGVSEHGKEGTDLGYCDFVSPPFYLNLDARPTCAERVRVSDDVDALVWSWWRYPGDVVAHRSQQCSDEILDVIRRELGEMVSDLLSRRLVCFLQGYGRVRLVALYLVRLIFAFDCGATLPPYSVQTNRLPHEVGRVRELVEDRPAVIGDKPGPFILDQPAGLDGGDRVESQNLVESSGARILGVVGTLKCGWREDCRDLLDDLAGRETLRLIGQNLEYRLDHLALALTGYLGHAVQLGR